MKTTRIAIAISLVLATAPAWADGLPAQAQRIWAPTGDEIGLINHATGTWQVLDAYGDPAKLAEDWQLGEKYALTGLFGLHRVGSTGNTLTVRGFGTTEASGDLNGSFGLWGKVPGSFALSVERRGFDFFYDRDSERRDPGFPAPPPPPALAETPRLNWDHGDAAVKFHVADGLNFALTTTSNTRDGDKASLARGATGSAVPGVKSFDTSADELRFGGAFTRGALAADVALRLGQADGQRATNNGFAAVDDQKRYEGSLGVAYDFSTATRVLAHGALYRIESSPVETHGTDTTPMDGDTDVRTGQLALVQRLGPGLNLRLSAMLQGQDTESVAGPYSAIEQGVDRERSRQEYRVGLSHTGLPHTALKLQYRYRKTTLDEKVGLGGLPGYDTPTSTQSQDQDRTAHDVALSGRYTFSPAVKIKARVTWKSEDVDQTSAWSTPSGDPFLPLIGDYTRDRFDWQVSLPCRLGRTVLLDLGHQGLAQTYKVTADDVETTWDATRGFANVNWLATDRITLYGTAAVGIEKYEIAGGLTPAPGFTPFNYDGVTWRLTPGATIQLNDKWSVEGMYELVTFTEDADKSSTINALESDQDRILARARWQATPSGAFTVTYQRREFDENRWDDTIHDLYAVSFSGRF
jgi:hypothetical protein